MPEYEYKVIPTPRRPRRAKGVRGEPARFANVLTDAINEVATDGWEFVRTETLPMEAKSGLFSRRTEVFQSVMVFRRDVAVEEAAAEVPSAHEPAPVETTAVPALTAVADPGPTPSFDEPATPQFAFKDNAERDVLEEVTAEPEHPEDVVAFDVENRDPLQDKVDDQQARTTDDATRIS